MKIISAGSLAHGRFRGRQRRPPRPRVVCIHASPTIVGEFLE